MEPVYNFLKKEVGMLSMTTESRIETCKYPTIPNPFSITHPEGNKKIVFRIEETIDFAIYRIVAHRLRVLPVSELESRLVGSETPFWDHSYTFEKVCYQFKEDRQTLELKPGSFDKIQKIFFLIKNLREDELVVLKCRSDTITITEFIDSGDSF